MAPRKTTSKNTADQHVEPPVTDGVDQDMSDDWETEDSDNVELKHLTRTKTSKKTAEKPEHPADTVKLEVCSPAPRLLRTGLTRSTSSLSTPTL
jgi:hypothetical protein